MFRCKCGVVCADHSGLRLHIALCTDRWPSVRCDTVHHDPTDHLDLKYIEDKMLDERVNRALNTVH